MGPTPEEIRNATAAHGEALVALIKDGEVVGVAVVREDSANWLDAMAEDHDAIQLVGENERPAPGWKVKDGRWQRPPEPEPTPEEAEAREQDAAVAEETERLIAEAREIVTDPDAPVADKREAVVFLAAVESAASDAWTRGPDLEPTEVAVESGGGGGSSSTPYA